jgi:hypothetical protein
MGDTTKFSANNSKAKLNVVEQKLYIYSFWPLNAILDYIPTSSSCSRAPPHVK